MGFQFQYTALYEETTFAADCECRDDPPALARAIQQPGLVVESEDKLTKTRHAFAGA